MYCKKCGSPLAPTDLFCRNCGTAVNQVNEENVNNGQALNKINTNEQGNYFVQAKEINKNNNKFGVASLIIGIISLILSYFLNFLILPLAITGLILGLRCKVKDGKRTAGITLNLISIIFIIVVLIIAAIFMPDIFRNAFEEYYSSTNLSTINMIAPMMLVLINI